MKAMQLKSNRRPKNLFFVAPLILGLLSLAVVFSSLQWIGSNLKVSREQELVIHAHAVMNSLRSQIFERYADSQAFSLNPILIKALENPNQDNFNQASHVLDKLVEFYKVYQASVLTNVQGQVIALNMRKPDGSLLDTNKWKSFPGMSANRWIADSNLPKTIVSDLRFQSKWKDYFGDAPIQTFSSPVLDASGQIIGAITNYTSVLYVEREMDNAFQNFVKMNLPSMRIYLLNDVNQLIGTFENQKSDYGAMDDLAPVMPEGKSFTESDNLVRSQYVLEDKRLPNIPKWRVVLEAKKDDFFDEVNSIRYSSYLLASLFFIVIFYFTFLLFRFRAKQERTLSKRLMEVQEEERSRISREVHDELGQNLTAIKIHLSRVQSENLDDALERIQDAKEMIEVTNDVARRISRELHPSLIENLGLVEALKWKINGLQTGQGIHCVLQIADGLNLDHLPKDVKGHVFRIVQESLNNIQKHAKCSAVQVNFRRERNEICFTITDNGVGLPATIQTSSMGIRNIRERAQLIGGQVHFQSEIQKGTTVVCRIPNLIVTKGPSVEALNYV